LRIVDNGGHGTEGDATYIRRTGVAVFPRRLRGSLARGCTSGTLGGMQQRCEATFGLLESKKVSCTGSVDTVSGWPSLSIIEIDEDLNGTFELETTVTVERGEAKAHVTDVDDKQVGGEVSPGDPLRIVTQVYPEEAPGSEDEEKVDLQIKVAEGEEIRGLRYEATMIAED
jgi:hypothetical protein